MDSQFSTRTKGKRNAWKKKAALGLALVVAGLAPVATLAWYQSSRNFAPVDVAMPPQPTGFHTDTFTINYPGTYFMDYRVPRTLPAEKLQCLLGLEDQHPEQCPDGQPRVTTSWRLRREDGTVAAQGRADHWEYGKSGENDVSAGIGSLHMNAGAYALEVSVGSEFGSLATLHPRLVVEIHPEDTDWFTTAYIIAFFFGVAFVPAGLWKLGTAAVESTGWPRR